LNLAANSAALPPYDGDRVYTQGFKLLNTLKCLKTKI
jgi:hypothetical protein